MFKPIPEGIDREKKTRRTNSIGRLKEIINKGGAVGEMLSVFERDDSKTQRGSLRIDDPVSFDDIDLDTKADPATYSFYGRLINKECKDKGIPSPYPGGIEWTFRNTKDRVWTVNTLMYLLIQRRTAEQFILDMKETIDILHDKVSKGEAKIKELTEVVAEKDGKISVLNPEREIKRKTDAYHAREELFRQKEESFLKQAEAFKRKEQQMEIDYKKLTKHLANTRKAKMDAERKNQLIQNQKRNLETQYINIQKRLKSKLDQASKKYMSDLSMQQIGEYTLFETEEEKRKRKLKDKAQVAWDVVEDWNAKMMESLEGVKSENEILRSEIEDLKQRQLGMSALSDLSRSHLQTPNQDLDNESHRGPSVYDFYFAKITDIFAEYVPESVDEVSMVLQSFPQKEHYIYERVCGRFGITPVPEYLGPTVINASLTESNIVKSGLNRNSFRQVELKVGENEKVPRKISTRSMTSLSWLDDNAMDDISVELERGWSFADSISIYSKHSKEIGNPTSKQPGNSTPC